MAKPAARPAKPAPTTGNFYAPPKPAASPAVPAKLVTNARPIVTGKPAVPGAQRNAMASARNKGQQGAAMRSSSAKPNPKAPLGQGGRFAAVAAKARASGARNPAAVAATVGRRKYGAARMAKMSAAGRKAK